MGLTASGGADALRAVREAIGSYMDMRQQRFQNERALETEGRADRALRLQEQNAKLDAEQFYQTKLNQERQLAMDIAAAYSGQETDPGQEDFFSRIGMGGLIEPATIPSRTISMPMQAPDMSPQPYGPQPSAPMTIADQRGRGRHFRDLSSERMQIAQFNALARANEGMLNRQSREEIAANRLQAMVDQYKQSNEYRARALDYQKRGLDQQLENMLYIDAARQLGMDNTTFNAAMSWLRFQQQQQQSPLGMIQQLQQGGIQPVAPPAFPTRQPLPTSGWVDAGPAGR